MVSLEIGSLLVFLFIVAVLVYKDRKNISFNYGLVIRRWEGGVKIIDRLVKKYPTFIRRLGNVGVAIGVIAGIGGMIILIALTVKLQQSFALVLPTAGGYEIPGPVFSVPFWYWFIAIFIIALTHETFHAIFIRLEKVPLKNYGIMMLLLLPIGAFVDPDNNRIKRLAMMKKLRIFAAGSFINFIVGFLSIGLFLLSVLALDGLTNTSGVEIASVDVDSPADMVNLQGKIQKFNDVQITSTQDFVNAMNTTQVGDQVIIVTDIGSYTVMLEEHPQIEDRPYIGIKMRELLEYNLFGMKGIVPLGFLEIFFVVSSFLNWLFMISLGVGVVNMLPVKPLDGGLFFEEIFVKYFGNKGKLLIRATTILIVGILIFNLFIVPWLRSLIG